MAYSTGGYSFETETEYEKALKEQEAIKLLCSKCDIIDPEICGYILNLEAEGKLELETSLGKAFHEELLRTIEGRKGKASKQEKPADGRPSMTVKNKAFRILYIAAVAVLCLTLLWTVLKRINVHEASLVEKTVFTEKMMGTGE